MGKSWIFNPNPKNKQIQGQLTQSGSGLLKSFQLHVIEIVFVEMDWVVKNEKKKSRLVKIRIQWTRKGSAMSRCAFKLGSLIPFDVRIGWILRENP